MKEYEITGSIRNILNGIIAKSTDKEVVGGLKDFRDGFMTKYDVYSTKSIDIDRMVELRIQKKSVL